MFWNKWRPINWIRTKQSVSLGQKRGADDMRDMITTLLDAGRLEAGEMPLRLQDHDLAEIARQRCGSIYPCPTRSRPPLRDAAREPVAVSCDADVIRRILENLISNALKFTKSDGTNPDKC